MFAQSIYENIVRSLCGNKGIGVVMDSIVKLEILSLKLNVITDCQLDSFNRLKVVNIHVFVHMFSVSKSIMKFSSSLQINQTYIDLT